MSDQTVLAIWHLMDWPNAISFAITYALGCWKLFSLTVVGAERLSKWIIKRVEQR